MSGGPRPPVPGLIPLAALSRRPGRPRRRPESSASIDADGAGSRCLESRAATPGSRRRHHHRRRASTTAPVISKQSRSSSPALDRPPRVNPIFVWVRQEDTRIVEVKCEDYDKRNRILLTKTAHGWRAIPRTEMLSGPRASAEEPPTSPTHQHRHHHHHHHKRRSRKSKNQHSTSVQCPEQPEPESSLGLEPSWVTTENINIESLLPSHTIPIKRIPSTENLTNSVNSASEQDFARTIPECSTPDKVCDVSPLENLLAVAELELKQHMQSGSWSNNPEPETTSKESSISLEEILQTKSHQEEDNSSHQEKSDDDEMSMNDILSRLEQSLHSPHGFGSNAFDDEMLEGNCKFDKEIISNDKPDISTTDDQDQYNLECIKEEFKEENDTIDEFSNNENDSQMLVAENSLGECTTENSEFTVDAQNAPVEHNDLNQLEYKEENEEMNDEDDKSDDPHIEQSQIDEILEEIEPEIDQIMKPAEEKIEESQTDIVEAESSTTLIHKEEPPLIIENDSICLDLSIKKSPEKVVEEETDEGPTDLCIRKPELPPPRSPSQNSEAIQSPEPSGIPAVPASPDIVSTSTSISKPRSVFLESLLANSMNKLAQEIKNKEPLDLGHQNRKSASPTVTCSEEIITPRSENEPPIKKLKPNDITLKNLLDKEIDSSKQTILPDTPKLLGLLKTSSNTHDPMEEYKQLLQEVDVPNPLMVPKEVFPELLKHPKREILKILSGHSNKNAALDDILVVYKDKLLAAIESNQKKSCKETHKTTNKYKNSEQNNNLSEKVNNNKRKMSTESPPQESRSSLANDIDAANEATLNPLFWAGCPNPFEAMNMNNYQNHNEFIQALYTLPYLHPELQMMLGQKMAPPIGFPSPIPPVNPFELSMWQEAMMQASMLKKNPYESNVRTNSNNNLQKKGHHNQHNNNSNHNKSPKMTNNNNNNKNISMMPPAAFNHPNHNWQNPYLGLSSFPQTSNNLALDTSNNQFNPFSHKNSLSPNTNKQLSPPILHQKKSKEANNMFAHYEQEKMLHQHMMEQQKMQQMHQQQKLIRQHQHQQLLQQQQQIIRQNNEKQLMINKNKSAKQNTLVPIDLSGLHSNKSKFGKSNSMVTSSRSHVEDVPEVGSTTEDLQDGHAQLWHPLFGSHQNKTYNPWNLPSLAAMGE
ncbi:unnamed protein product [Ceutorhynchus assimilis]|uniref:Uncharacterized protein n=1 Tax=Ceutorhynchus assimilis TaxID=467358 RepID=A0A9N9QJT6_9CUCU|nr:unnamed protein product [Ceutorhynchus assimilis]